MNQSKSVQSSVQAVSGDVVLFRTDWSRFLGTEKYYQHPELSRDVIQWLISKQAAIIGIDAVGLGRGRKHGEYDRLLVQHDIFILENLTNLAAIPERTFTVYCFPLSIAEIDAIPARVIVETS